MGWNVIYVGLALFGWVLLALFPGGHTAVRLLNRVVEWDLVRIVVLRRRMRLPRPAAAARGGAVARGRRCWRATAVALVVAGLLLSTTAAIAAGWGWIDTHQHGLTDLTASEVLREAGILSALVLQLAGLIAWITLPVVGIVRSLRGAKPAQGRRMAALGLCGLTALYLNVTSPLASQALGASSRAEMKALVVSAPILLMFPVEAAAGPLACLKSLPDGEAMLRPHPQDPNAVDVLYFPVHYFPYGHEVTTPAYIYLGVTCPRHGSASASLKSLAKKTFVAPGANPHDLKDGDEGPLIGPSSP